MTRIYIDDLKNGKYRIRFHNFHLYSDSVSEADQLAKSLYEAACRESSFREQDLSQLVMSLCRQLPPEHEWRAKAHDALKRWGVFVSPLKEDE